MKHLTRIVSVALLLTVTPAILADTVAFTGATVHTMGPQGTVENATVVIADGRFIAVTSGTKPPADARVIDAKGKIITPGFFSAMGHIGLTEVSAVAGTVDFYQAGMRFSASFDIADAYNHRSILSGVNRAGGITRALTAPAPGTGDGSNAGQVFSGLAAVVQLGDHPEFVTQRAIAMVVNLGEVGSGVANGSRAAAMLSLRAALQDARYYNLHGAEFRRGEHRPYSLSMEDLQALQAVLRGETPLLANVNRASDIEVLVGLARSNNLKLIIYGGAEAWMIADLLADNGVAVILDSKANLPASFDALNSRLEAAALLVAAGVDISFGADWQSETHVARNIVQSAGNAVANGLPWIDALRAITLAPAKMFGIDDQIGSIEAGKEADLIVWSADPLELTSNPETVMIRGRQVSLVNRQTLLRDRYMQTDSGKPPAFRD